MAVRVIDEKDLPPADKEEIEFARSAKDSQIDTSDIPKLTASQLKEAAVLAKEKRSAVSRRGGREKS